MCPGLDRRELRSRLAEGFDGSRAERRVVARAAGDLADSGQYERHTDAELTVETVVDHLRDAPAPARGASDGGVATRWNWWMGSLELAFGGYERFRVYGWTAE